MIALINGNNEIYYVLENERQNYSDREATQEEIDAYKSNLELEHIRNLRQECFAIINRGELWYNKLTEEQKTELSAWYEAWLNVPQVYEQTKPTNIETIIPTKPSWLK